MATVKRIVCLANSRKLHGRCVAGREFDSGKPGAWVRPVSDREHEEVSEYERQYQDGTISLAEPFNGRYFKLVAAVIPRP